MKKQSFLQASLLLTVSAVFAKLCGALFKLPLTNLLGGTGMGYFSCAYGLFLPLYAVFVTGISTAVARPVADFAGRGNLPAALRVRHVARIFCAGMGLAGTVLAIVLAKSFTLRTSGSLDAYPAVLAIAPAVFLCCLTAVERGYYEGLCSMTPTAVSQGIEAVTKLLSGLFLGKLFYNFNYLNLNFSPESRGALGAVLGVTLSTLTGYLWMIFQNFMQKNQNKNLKNQDLNSDNIPADREIFKILIRLMIPAALGALVTNLTSLVDLMTMMRCFQNMLAENIPGFYQKACISLEIPVRDAPAFVYGSFMGLSVTVFNLVPSLTNMLAKGVLPCTAQAWAAGDRKSAANYARQVLILTGMLAIPAGCGIFVLAEPILEFLFAGRDAEILTASAGLRWLAPALIFLCLAFPVFSLLQAIGKEHLPVQIMLVGIVVKILLNFLLIPEFCTAGAAISTSVCYLVILIFAILALRKALCEKSDKKAGENLHLVKPFFSQIWGGILCAGSAWVCYDRMIFHGMHQKISLMLAILCAVLIYILVLFLSCPKELKEFKELKEIRESRKIRKIRQAKTN
ncbi:MAG: polysaccharide biosynthesis C-terminal domain-containing protein [Oscillospiraceae bacterium]|nr:polysaccharide biosynthesis C-terminal domain-containing protein [Oscillospiraceae bacterium]